MGTPDSMKARMSFLVTRPPRPVPGTRPTSTLCSAAMRATTGETKVLPSPAPSVGAGAEAGGAAVSAGCFSGAACSATGSGSGAGSSSAGFSSAGAAGAAAPDPITASFVPTSTVSPSWTKICCSIPVPGEGTSVSTLSVEISSSGSSAATSSPSCLSHFVIVPSETETPIWGMTTSMAVSVAISRRRAP